MKAILTLLKGWPRRILDYLLGPIILEQRAELRRLNEAWAAAQDAAQTAQAELSECRADLAAARQQTIESEQRVTDWMAVRVLGRPIHSLAPPPPQSAPHAMPPTRMQARAAQRQDIEAFLKGADAMENPA